LIMLPLRNNKSYNPSRLSYLSNNRTYQINLMLTIVHILSARMRGAVHRRTYILMLGRTISSGSDSAYRSILIRVPF